MNYLLPPSTIRFLAIVFFAISLLFVNAQANAHEVIRFFHMDGANGATASGVVTIDLDLVTLQVQMQFSGLSSNVLTSHIHATTSLPLTGNAPIATLNFFDSALLSNQEKADLLLGKYDHTFDLTVGSSYDAAFVTGSGGTVSDALNKLIFAAEDEKSYLTIKTSNFPSGEGELKGFLTAVPEPSSWMTLGLAISSVMFQRFRRSRPGVIFAHP